MTDEADFGMIRYFDIAWVSTYDGPGYRVVLFLQGCHLRCPWCHSPHSWRRKSPLLFMVDRCTYCGACAGACPRSVHTVTTTSHRVDRDRCTGCGQCVEVCPVSSLGALSGALSLPTSESEVGALWQLLYPQLALVRSIGGITLSGGEALLQLRAVQQLLRLAREAAVPTAVETSGTLPPAYVGAVIELVDCWLFGLRPTPFYPVAGRYRERIEANLQLIAGGGRRVIIRTPVIAGITDGPESLSAIADSMERHGLSELQLLPYNPETPHYYCALDRHVSIGLEAIPSPERVEAVRQYFCERSIQATVIQ